MTYSHHLNTFNVVAITIEQNIIQCCNVLCDS